MIIAWQYHKQQGDQSYTIIEKIEKKGEELRCMDFIDKQIEYLDEDDDDDFEEGSNLPKKNTNQSKLFVGTNQNGLIITIDISHLLEMDNVESEYDPDVMNHHNKFEEEKMPDGDYNYMEMNDNMREFQDLQKNFRDVIKKK